MEKFLKLVREQSIEKQYGFCDALYGILVKNSKIPKGSLMLLIVYADAKSIVEAMSLVGIAKFGQQDAQADLLPCGHSKENLVVNNITQWCDACETARHTFESAQQDAQRTCFYCDEDKKPAKETICQDCVDLLR